jgi:hypothetical protein
MPAGLPYFAWVDAGETTFLPEHMRWDENIFSFTLAQDEGDPANLTVVVRRPRNIAGDPIGLLGPGRKIWAWFALDCGDDLIRFRGRLVGVPTSIFEELVTLEFVARPFDVVAQKAALAETLRVLPHYDEVVIDKERRNDPEVVLEGYSKIWHYDRETHALTVSDEVTGEDGLVEFDGASEDGKVLWDGLGLTLTSGPLARVDVVAEFTWSQQGQGNVDLTRYLIDGWPKYHPNTIASYSLTADSWPKNGTGIGDGWIVAQASAREVYDLTVHSRTFTEGVETKVSSTASVKVTATQSVSSPPMIPPGSIQGGGTYTQQSSVSYSNSPSGRYVSSLSYSYSGTASFLPLHHIQPTLVAAYTANRQCTERVAFSLFADVQHILTDPEDGEALRIDDIRSVNLSEPIGEGSEAYVPIVDPRRRSYIATERGNQSLEHLIALARAHLMKRARVVEITFAPKLSRMPDITLRKNAFLIEPRVGEALGKIVGYSIALDGADGRINCEVRIGCAIGRGGSAVATGGTPTYCSIDYVGADYQQFVDRTVLFDSSVGYQPPSANPNDDGINFMAPVSVADVIELPLVVENPYQEQYEFIVFAMVPEEALLFQPAESPQAGVFSSMAMNEKMLNRLKMVPTTATFKLKSMTREFESDYEIQMTNLKIPTGIDLEAA